MPGLYPRSRSYRLNVGEFGIIEGIAHFPGDAASGEDAPAGLGGVHRRKGVNGQRQTVNGYRKILFLYLFFTEFRIKNFVFVR
jgi:hypothetical protein